MATTSTSELVQDIISDIPEVPVFVAGRQYIRALRVLCERSRVWRTNFQLDTIADQASYDVSGYFSPSLELVDIISMKPVGGGEPVRAKTQAWLDENVTSWRSETSSVAKYFVMESNNTIRLVSTPAETATDAYYVRAAIKPTINATDVDDLIHNKFSELLYHGAKAFLFMTPRKPWTDLQLAQYHQSMFELGIPEARAKAADEFQTGVARKVKYGGY